jgi:hypothetical protein
LSTFRFVGSKHPLSYSLDPVSREVVFRFSGIQLLPSADSLEGSQGYFTYEIKELANLTLNSEITNTAYIYFDFNPAIITNTTLNINGYVGLNETPSSQLEVYPNPSNGVIQIKGIEEGQLLISSMTGQTVFQQSYKKGDIIDLSSLQSGIYFLQMKTVDSEFIRKVNFLN